MDQRTRHDLFKKKGVHFIGRGWKWTRGQITQEQSVVFGVSRKLPREALLKDEIVPDRIDGIKTDVRQHRMARAYGFTPREFTRRERPFPIGRSIGHYTITAGTVGAFVEVAGSRCILSNNHVLAASNAGASGDAIVQPGPYDGGQNPADQVATLRSFVPIQFVGAGLSECPISGAIIGFLNGLAKSVGSSNYFKAYADNPLLPVNYVDCALGELSLPDLAKLDGNPVVLGDATLGTRIQKTGRTTELTEGTVDLVDLAIQVAYDQAGTLIAYFEDQIGSETMLSSPGDSGSSVLSTIDGSLALVGLLFAGSDTMTVCNRSARVSEALGGLYNLAI